MTENSAFLTSQLITYLGNKRSLIGYIENEVKQIAELLHKDKLVCADLFSGSGVVARLLKGYSSQLIVNDLEDYSRVINSCYLSNKKDYPARLCSEYRKKILALAEEKKLAGIITKNYAPKNDKKIQKGERVFYTHQNALLLDTYRTLIDKVVEKPELRRFFLAPLITEASVHTNTSGVFKGFYKDKNTGLGCFGASGKDALTRILGAIELKEPVFSNFESDLTIYQKDAVELAGQLKGLDITYLDPPYNQHPYGSNYFMLNLILKNTLFCSQQPALQLLRKGVRHQLTHRTLLVDFYLWEPAEEPVLPDGYRWIDEAELDRYAKPRLFELLLESLPR